MGAKSHMQSEGFSADLNSYLRKVLSDHGKEDLSGKWLESVTDKARRYDYWSRFVKDERAMTTNDIQVLARTFGVSPYEWVANTRRHAAGQPVPVVRLNVGGHAEDYEQSDYPDGLRNAAETKRNPGD